MSLPSLTDLVKRPGIGTLGRSIQVRTNHFGIQKLPDTLIYHYDISITPAMPVGVNRKIFTEFMNLYGVSDLDCKHPVYDGRSNMFSPKEFPFETRTFDVTLIEETNPRGEAPSFRVRVKKVATINLWELHQFLQGKSRLTNNCLASIMALDILIHFKPAMLYFIVARSFFLPTNKQILAGGLEAWRGFYQSVRPAAGKLTINIDISATAFYQSGSLIEQTCKFLNLRSTGDLHRSAPPINWVQVERHFKGVRIRVIHRQARKRTFKIYGMTKASARETVFKISAERKEGDVGASQAEAEIDVASYFKQAYNISLSYPSLPCIVVSKKMILPMEVCTIVEGQRYMRKLNERQTADMIKFTSQSPAARANIIKDGINLLKYEDNEYLNEFGLKVSNEMETTKARILPSPTLQFHPTSKEPRHIPREGAWNLKDKKVIRGATLGSWGVVVFGNERTLPPGQAQAFLREFIVACTDTGMAILNKNPPISYLSPQGNIEEGLKKAWLQAGNAVKSQPQLLICILPNTGVQLYAEIKRVTDTFLGVASQCLQSKQVGNPRRQYCANVCLKINVKLGGANVELAPGTFPILTTRPIIIFGADVSHPQPGDDVRPSIATLVGSMDSKAARYAAAVRIQTARTETIADLSDMVMELLKTFYQSCGEKPERILFFRDGVSEGQFAEVLKIEVPAIRAACQRLEISYMPAITFIVVQKRHRTRFFPMKASDGDRSGNCLAGTVVDTGIVHPFEFDFYLQSQSGLLGTSRPVHYHVLLDNSNFTADELQDLSFKLCHLYARSTRAVSLVPPVYYAHIIGTRVRYHSRGDIFSEGSSEGTVPSGSGAANSYVTVRPDLMKVMWFM
ncbi:Piwi domain-domain-containing protein [Lobosporangium transversale]|uniref:Piwi domain-domain-containing protein n=1 Tax=Lobosporangium transversale TaxID=64571 RepID=A0A1Y2GPS9_9FUNG|nr:Piwi domain-domain-containing protein [Lobosporangium transversale]ORZ13829.1 Piwi domain-domain-containing protein [Lobosporangium transversale]|eukprot:XP_021880613.1 Piwi domain-domain-containing protein [Lobosporangium transversale]